MDTNAHIDPNPVLPSEHSAEPVVNLRTYMSDVAKLIQNNQLNAKELSKIDPAFLQAVKRGEIPTSISTKVNQKRPETSVAFHQSSASSKNNEDTFIDLDSIEKITVKEVSKSSSTSTSTSTSSSAPKPLPTPKPMAPGVKKVEVKSAPTAPAAPVPAHVPAQAPKPALHVIIKPIPQVKSEVKPKPLPVVTKPVQPLTPEQKIQQDAQKLQAELKEFEVKETALHTQEVSLESQKDSLNTQSHQLNLQERQAEQNEADLRRQASSVISPREQYEIEKKRWGIEDERQRFERQRWAIDQQILEFEKRITDIVSKESELKEHEQSIQGNLDILHRQQLAIKAQADRKIFTSKLNEIRNSRTKLEVEWQTVMAKKEQVIQQQSLMGKKQSQLQGEIESLEKKEHSSVEPTLIHTYEVERWKMDQQLRVAEQEKWKQTEALATIDQQIAEIEQKTQSVLITEKDTIQKIDELDHLIHQTEDSYNSR